MFLIIAILKIVFSIPVPLDHHVETDGHGSLCVRYYVFKHYVRAAPGSGQINPGHPLIYIAGYLVGYCIH